MEGYGAAEGWLPSVMHHLRQGIMHLGWHEGMSAATY